MSEKTQIASLVAVVAITLCAIGAFLKDPTVGAGVASAAGAGLAVVGTMWNPTREEKPKSDPSPATTTPTP